MPAMQLYYMRACAMMMLPTVKQLPGDGPIRLILVKAQRTLRQLAAASPSSSMLTSATIAAIGNVLSARTIYGHDYLQRAWTLAERMARHGRGERFSHWVSLTAWLGMVVDAMLQGSSSEEAVQAMCSVLGAGTGALLGTTLKPLAEATRTGSILIPACEGLVESIAEVLQRAAVVWATSGTGDKAPTDRAWLCQYLADSVPSGVYTATLRADLVWAVYSYHATKQLDVTSQEGLRAALEDLGSVAQMGSDARGRPEPAMQKAGFTLPARLYASVGLGGLLPEVVLPLLQVSGH